jgi:7,8-dihydropterin-6-yl-methyl-4-(beta-D-ribofuranosyl)aminobenzene 5'-phosphate synthase
MKIITLIENVTYKQGLVAEHGLSFYLETENNKIIFDTGQTGLFLQNAEKLGVNIEDIDTLVLSHGHYDHTGGLYQFLERNSKATVYAKKDVFIPKYHGNNRFIGTIYDETTLTDRIVFVDTITEIGNEIFIMPNIPIHHTIDTHFGGLNSKQGNEFIQDEFTDELFIVIQQKDLINIVTACSHRGITNICKTAVDYFKQPVGLILGGFHMKECSPKQYIHITNYLRQLSPLSLGVCHCTGVEQFAHFYHNCEARVFYNYTGNEITIL